MQLLCKLYQKIVYTSVQQRQLFQRVLPVGLSLLLLLILIWDELLLFDGYRWLRTIGLLSSIGVMLQQQRSVQQLKQQITVQAQAEQRYQNIITDLELTITQREQIQHDLAHKATLLQAIMDASPDLMGFYNEECQFLACNRATELYISKSRQQIIGFRPHHLFNEAVAQKAMESNRQLLQTNRSLTYEQWLPEQMAYLEVRKVPFYDQIKKERGILAFGRYITERKAI